MKKAIIVHGCADEEGLSSELRTYDKHWMPWLKRELIARGWKVETPSMPNPWKPDYDAYKKMFEELLVTEDTVLIGHSCGGAFLVRWLGDSKKKVGTLVLVAPWKIPDEGDSTQRAFYEYPIDPSIKDRVKEIIIFTSDDEEEEGKQSAQIFHDALGGRVVSLDGHGHYTLSDMGTEEFPELLEVLLK